MAAPVVFDQEWVTLRSWTSYVTALTYHSVTGLFFRSWTYKAAPSAGDLNYLVEKKGQPQSLSLFFSLIPVRHPLLATLVWHKPCASGLPLEGHTCLSQVFSASSHLPWFFTTSLILYSPFCWKWETANLKKNRPLTPRNFIFPQPIMVDFFPLVANILHIVFPVHQKSISIARQWTLPGPECNMITASITSCACRCPWSYWRS